MNEQEQIINATGTRIHSCQCNTCVGMCHRCPCIGTPDDIKKLIQHGYIHKLAISTWAAGFIVGISPMITMVASKMDAHGGCPFFKNGLCSLHDSGLKPLEGKLASHDDAKLRKSSTLQVAQSWINPANESTIEWIAKAFNRYEK